MTRAAAISRLNSNVFALALAIASLALIAACGLQAAKTYLADHDPDLALGWGLASPDSLSMLAQQRLSDPTRPDHDADATRFARRALLSAPLDARALRVLALETERSGGLTRARMLMVIADKWTRRDSATQLWQFEQALAEGDWPGASLHADALLRRRWQLYSIVYPGLAGALRDPAAVAPVVQTLNAVPDWRGPFLSFLAWRAADPAVAARLFLALAAGPVPPTDEDDTNLVGRAISQGDYAGARALWTRLLPRGSAGAADLVYDGDFRPAPGAAPFNWRLIQSEGVTAEIVPAADGAPALHVLAPAAKSTAAAEELISLPPGIYRLSGRALVEPGQTGDLFSWRVSCVAQPDTPIAEAPLAAGPVGWRPFSADFQVDQGCAAQWLRLEGLAHTGFEPAEAWYRGLAIQPLMGKIQPPR
jgi:hypothetical protein